MAEAAVEFALQTIKEVLLYYGNLISNVKPEVEGLDSDLRLFTSFLKEYAKTLSKEDEPLKELVRQIRNIVYEIEDVIDAYVTLGYDNKSDDYFRAIFQAPKIRLVQVAEDVKVIKEKIQRIMDKNRIEMVKDRLLNSELEHDQQPIKVLKVREDNIVGFEDEMNTLVKYLMEDSKELDVISIIGLPGNGKTTLAGLIFRHDKIEFEFPTRIWVYVSADFKKRDVFLALFTHFCQDTDSLKHNTDEEIAHKVRKHLAKGKFLIIMDDVWTAGAWKELQVAFPHTGKVLITSRQVEVAREANRKRNPHVLRFLTFDESLRLLKLEVFHEDDCPPELQTHAELIAKKCKGLPLAIVVIGGILVRKSKYEDIMATENTWRAISDSVPAYLEEDRDVEEIISLSYNKLPYNLRPCFLYVGMFPEDFEIPVWTLIRLWVAEGFIQQRTGAETLEDTALDYLEELINRNLVMAGRISTDGKIKTCRIHDTLRQFCRKEAGPGRENFFQEIKYSRGRFEPPTSALTTYRRLCVPFNIMDFTSSQLYGPRVRSFLCCSKEENFDLPSENHSFIPKGFRLLRTLDAKPITFTKFPKDLSKLVHLRYVVMSSNFKVIPDAISKLRNLQTLVVYTTSRSIEIRANIWQMIQLRHVKTNASAILPKVKNSNEGQQLQTLGTISPSCTKDMFDRLRTLRKLGIRGLLVALLEAEGLDKLEYLEKLKLVNDVHNTSPKSHFSKPSITSSKGKLPRLPPPYKFPPNLRSLTLSATSLNWSNMSTLGMLGSLEVLKLKENAFAGERWEATAGGFGRLAVFHIERTDLMVWVADAKHFPRLKRVVVRNCENLVEVPKGLVENLEKLELRRVSESVCKSARDVEEKRKEKEKESGASIRSKFKLTIAPGDE